MKVCLYCCAVAMCLALGCAPSKPLEVPEDQTEFMRLNYRYVGTLPNGKKVYVTSVRFKDGDDIQTHYIYFNESGEINNNFLFYKGKYRRRKVIADMEGK
jgi:hypothetical protein